MNKETVLCYIEKEHQFLMLFRNKKKEDINKGKYIGIGGHIEKDETKEEALKREVKEETGLTLLSYQYRGKILFQSDELLEIMHLFTSSEFIGELIDCDEGELHWINIKDILNYPHWEGDEYFLKKLINNEPYFEMSLIYQNNLLKEVKERIG